MTEEMSKKVIEFTQDYYKWSLRNNDKFCIERYVDYRDELSDSSIHEILNAKYPIEKLNDIDCDCDDWYYEDEFFKELREFCEENEIDEDEARCEVEENFYWAYPDNFLNPTINTVLTLNLGDMNYDFTKHNILNYASNYGYCEGLENVSGLYWLAKQQGHLGELQKAIKFQSPKVYESTRELHNLLWEYSRKLLKNYHPDMTTINDIQSHITTWDWFLKRDGEDDSTIRKLTVEMCKKYDIPTFHYEQSSFTKSCIQELENQCCHMTALTFLVKMPLLDVIDIKEHINTMENKDGFDKYNPQKTKRLPFGYITLGKQTQCGLVDPGCDSGSVIEIELEKDVKIPFQYIWNITDDKAIQSCYGLCDSCWEDSVKEIKLKEIA